MTLTVNQTVRRLNEQHMKYSAGFYGDDGGRYFKARAHKGTLQVSPDFGRTWTDATNLQFHDHNGRSFI